jgi:hypothetical protein
MERMGLERIGLCGEIDAMSGQTDLSRALPVVFRVRRRMKSQIGEGRKI